MRMGLLFTFPHCDSYVFGKVNNLLLSGVFCNELVQVLNNNNTDVANDINSRFQRPKIRDQKTTMFFYCKAPFNYSRFTYSTTWRAWILSMAIAKATEARIRKAMVFIVGVSFAFFKGALKKLMHRVIWVEFLCESLISRACQDCHLVLFDTMISWPHLQYKWCFLAVALSFCWLWSREQRP